MQKILGTSLLVSSVLMTAGFTTMAMGQDECSTAVTAIAGGNPFDTTTATTSAQAVDDTQCTGTFLNWGVANKDVWFKYTATESGLLSINTCDAASFDTSIVLYSGTCAGLTQVACNGDGTGLAGCQGFYSNISGYAASAGDYYIRIGGYDDGAAGPDFGAGILSLSFQAANEGCLGATGDCGAVHTEPGCSDAICCTSVCEFDALCCLIGWDQNCLDAAVSLCGIFIYSCVPGGPANNCATNATNVGSADSVVAFSSISATTDGPGQLGSECASGSDNTFNDVWFKFTAAANGTAAISTCGTVSFDNKLAVYDMGTSPGTFNYNTLPDVVVGCIDDGASGTCMTTEVVPTNYAAELFVTVAVGHTYLVRNGSYAETDSGTGSVSFNLPEPCALDAYTALEGEVCGTSTNDGCNAGGVTEATSIGATIKGTFFLADDGAGGLTRDTDFYSFDVVGGDQEVTISAKSASFVTALILGGDITVADCAGISVLSTGAGVCPTSASTCLSAGSYFVFVGMSFDNPVTACGSGLFTDYSVSISSVPALCPESLSLTCDAPGPNTFSTNVDPNLSTQGLVACGVNPAFPACNTGGTTANRWCKPFPLGSVTGSISCLNIGVFSVVRDVNATNTACVNYGSDIALPTTITIYQDIDGAAPRNAIVTAGDGNDLAVVSQHALLIPGGAYKGTINYATPLCLDGVTGNLVVEMLNGDFFTGVAGVPGASGYGLRPAGNTPVGTTSSGTYCRLSCADASGQYVLCESVGATFLANWVVEFNGDFSGCGSNCPGDFNADGFITAADLSTLLGAWGTPAGDIDGDGNTSAADLSTLLGAWGACP